MAFDPTALDVWLAKKMATALGRHPLFDYSINSAIGHQVLGGLWFGGALFVWYRDLRSKDPQRALGFITTLAGSFLAIVLTLLAALLVHWPPPILFRDLGRLYPEFIPRLPGINSFPSQSTAVYSAVAAGVTAFHRSSGAALWMAVLLLVALPRMYVGGHWLSDVTAGLTCGLAGFVLARSILRRIGEHRSQALVHHFTASPLASALVFLWIVEMCVGFAHVAWARRILGHLLAGTMPEI